MKKLLTSMAVVGFLAGLSPLASAQTVELQTTHGNIQLQLNAEKAPKSVANFLQYVNEGHYDNTIFHRVINGFMIQGGGMTEDLKEKPTRSPIPLESGNGLRNKKGTVAMARTNAPNSATAQFFINVQDNAFLDKVNSPDGNGYAVFGSVIKGMDVVEKIKAVPTGNKGMHSDVPREPIRITKARVL